ncbi:MAG TPA: FemAB family XrtA/PEP-CTERM system-associated protein [Gemmatimonadaceae bacterium]|nr:FemAB family XrtA/PEP-CTERM system-associated protein [Gemmatimonadaceae bacterium]
MTIRVEKFSGTTEEWNAFASAQTGYTHFHGIDWRDLMEAVFGHECIYLAARGADNLLVAVLPLVRVRSLVFGHYLVSMPFLNYGGPLGTTAGIRAVVEEAVALSRRDRVKLLELRSRVPLDIPLQPSHRKITVTLPLPLQPQDLFNRFAPKLRAQIRRPIREGITVVFGRDQVDPFYSVFSRHMRDLGTPAQSKKLFREIADRFDDCWFGCAYLNGEPVAGGCGFLSGDEFEMTWASSLREFNRESPNMLLYWSFIEKSIASGLKRFNFGRCTSGSGTHRFKMQWGGREEQLWWYQHAAIENAKTPSPDDSAFSWGPRIWKKLPASVTTTVGPSIVRYIP